MTVGSVCKQLIEPTELQACIYMFLMRDEKEERKKQARSNKQTRQSNTAHPRQSLFLRKMSCLMWDSPTTLYTLDRVLYHLATKAARVLYH